MCLKRIGNELPEEQRNKIFKIVLELPDSHSLGNISFYSVCCFVRNKTPKVSDFTYEAILVDIHYGVHYK